MRRLTVVLRFPVAAFAALAAFVALGDKSGNGGPEAANVAPYRLYVDAMQTAESFKAPSANAEVVNASSVALGRKYMVARLARPGRPFVCTGSISSATHRVESTVSFLRSRENEFKAQTYGHSTKTTVWSLDVIVTILKGDVELFSKSVTSTYEERRPISESQFDNNIFHNLMVSAIEKAADEVLDFFDAEGGGSGRAVVSVSAASVPSATAASVVPADPRPPLAILKPEALQGVDDAAAMLIWDVLESSAGNGGAFRVISRSDIPRMQEEIGFTTSSDLVNLSSAHRARIGKIKTVARLLATTIGIVDGTCVMSFKVFDASTAEIEAGRSDTLSGPSLDAVRRQIPGMLDRILAAPPSGFVLMPSDVPVSMPRSVAGSFDVELSRALAASGIAVKSGTAWRYRIVPKVSLFSVRVVPEGSENVYKGSLSGFISVEGADVAPIMLDVNDVELGREKGAAPSWLTERYMKKLVSQVLGDATLLKGLSALSSLE